ncbi:MAG: fused MFS/spermidine synthase [Arthrobacter sp.]|jgi:hypothetical protein|nr:fused MFS/spermidine synthase [Arthrobacter sp.]
MSRHTPLRRRTKLAVSGTVAEWIEDPRRPGAWILEVGGAEQSTLVPGNPRALVYEYLQRIAPAIDAVGETGAPLHVLHLGGGALSLPRYVQATRPGSRQLVIDLDAELMPFVLESFPLEAPGLTSIVIGDVREALPSPGTQDPYDVVILDISLGPGSPERLLETDFYRELLALLAPEGTLLINVGDEQPLNITRRIAAQLSALGTSVWVSAHQGIADGRYHGNLILGASRRRWPRERLDGLRAAGPHPAAVLVGIELEGLGKP